MKRAPPFNKNVNYRILSSIFFIPGTSLTGFSIYLNNLWQVSWETVVYAKDYHS